MREGEKRLIVGLGNPGIRYQNTKHNLGFHLLERFAEKESIGWKVSKNFQSKLGQMNISGQTTFLLMPQTYMNLSGSAVQKCMAYYKINRQEVLIVCDDVDLDFGQLRLRYKGSSGGHNGLRNVIDSLRSPEVSRLRLGVGRDKWSSLEEDVVSPLTKAQIEQLPAFLEKGSIAIDAFIQMPIDKVIEKVTLLNQTNERKIIDGQK